MADPMRGVDVHALISPSVVDKRFGGTAGHAGWLCRAGVSGENTLRGPPSRALVRPEASAV